ncbi:MAG TPA: hypothetical protein VHS31_18955 [Tepidisphaeraceae bacterium]|nr:hypothetical protein [Tepidisphaeraceae bacterium]
MNDPRQPMSPGVPVSQPQGIARPPIAPPVSGVRPPVMQPPRPAAIAPKPASAPVGDPIALVEEEPELMEETPTPAVSKIKFGPTVGHKQHEWKRKPHVTGTGACRVKSFHAKYSDQGLEHLDDGVNEWLDGHPEVEVKFVTTSVHVFEGKIREPAIVMNVWY